jgi:hypothetical protein
VAANFAHLRIRDLAHDPTHLQAADKSTRGVAGELPCIRHHA